MDCLRLGHTAIPQSERVRHSGAITKYGTEGSLMMGEAQDLITRYIEVDPYRPSPDEAWLRDSGVPVWAIIGQLEVLKGDIEQVASDYGVPVDAVEAAIAYYWHHKPAIDARIQANRTAPAA